MVLIVPPMYLLSQAEQPGLSFSISALWLADHRGIVEKFKRDQDSKSQLIYSRANQDVIEHYIMSFFKKRQIHPTVLILRT